MSDHAPEPDEKKSESESPHGLVEELREEIGQAVEHAVEAVPKPVRWTFRKLFLLAVLAIVALVVITIVSVVLYFANRTELVANELVLFVNGTLARRTDLVLDIADIHGDPLHQVTLVRPRLRFRDGNGPVLLEAPRAQLRYSAWGLLSRRGRFVEIDLVDPTIRLTRTTDGRIRLPVWKSAGAATRTRQGFDVGLRIRGGKLAVPDPLGNVEGLELDASVATGTATRVEVKRLAWKSGFYATKNLRLQGEVSSGDSVLFVVSGLHTADLALSGRAGWKKGDPRKNVHLDVAHVRWRWLAEAIHNKTFDVDGQGRILVDAKQDADWRGRFASDAVWKQEPVVASGEFVWSGQRLAVAPLRAASKAGNVDGVLEVTKPGWEIRGAATDADPSRWSVIGINNWPPGKLNGEFRYAEDRLRHSALVRATLTGSELSGWVADAAEVAVDFPAQGPDSFTVHMMRRGGDVTLRGVSAEGGWHGQYVADRMPLEEWPDGRKSGIRGILDHGEGTVAGHEGTLDVTGVLDGHGTDWLGAHMARWRLEDVAGRLLPTSDLTTRATLGDMLFLGIHWDSTAMALHLVDQSADLDSVAAHASDTLVTMAGHATWNDANWRLSLSRAEARSKQFDWVADPPLLLAGDRQGVLFDRMRAHDGNASLDATGRWANPGGFYDWRLQARSLDLAHVGMPPEWGFVGLADGTLEVRGVSGNPNWTFEGVASKPGWQGHRADSLDLALAGSPGRLEVRHGVFRLEGGTIAANGSFEDTKAPWPDSLDAIHVHRWLSTAARWRGEVRADQMPLDRLERMAPAARGWTGKVSGRLAFAGSPEHPELDVQASAKPLAWQDYLVDEMKTTIRYRDERLEVKNLDLVRKDLVSKASGSMPLVLRLGGPPVLPESPMSWKLEVPNGDLAVLPLFIQQFGAASGRFELHAQVEGTPKHPELAGNLKIRDASVRMAGREETLDHVAADLSLDESHITLDSLTAREGERGLVSATGRVALANGRLESYQFDLKMREFTAIETGVYAAVLDGDFKVTNGPMIGGHAVPHVAGRADIRRAAVYFDFANQSEMQKIAAGSQTLFWTYRIQVNANNNLHWQPPDGDIEFNASLSVEQTPDELIIYGDMHEIRGTYFFLSNRFNVDKADLTFDNVGGVNPQLDVQATTRIRPSGTIGGQFTAGRTETDVPHDVTVTITGRANEPALAFASNPTDWDENTILQELTVGRFVSGSGNVALTDPLGHYLTRAISRTLSSEMSRVFQGYISEWELQRESGEGDMYLSVGSQITPSLLVRYRQRLPGFGHDATTPTSVTNNPFERDVEAEYRINRFFYITSEVTQRRILGGATTPSAGGPDFNLNLKARWEY